MNQGLKPGTSQSQENHFIGHWPFHRTHGSVFHLLALPHGLGAVDLNRSKIELCGVSPGQVEKHRRYFYLISSCVMNSIQGTLVSSNHLTIRRSRSDTGIVHNVRIHPTGPAIPGAPILYPDPYPIPYSPSTPHPNCYLSVHNGCCVPELDTLLRAIQAPSSNTLKGLHAHRLSPIRRYSLGREEDGACAGAGRVGQ